MIDIQDKVKGAFVGGAIGDALGFITERAWNEENLRKRASVSEVTDFVSWKKIVRSKYFTQIIPMEAGAYSDDTQLTLSVARSMDYNGLPFFDESHFRKELREWLVYQRGGGRAVKAAAKDTENLFHEGYTHAGGNGALMRSLPHVVANLKMGNFENSVKSAISDTLLTHAHPKAVIAEAFFMKYMREVLFGKNVFEAKEEAKRYIENFSLLSMGLVPKDWFEKWEKIEKVSYAEVEAKEVKEFVENLEWINSNLDLSEQEAYANLKACGKYGGAATATMLAVVFTLEKNFEKDFKSTVLKPVNVLCCDTDTVAELVGTVKGAVVGVNNIEDRLKCYLQDSYYIQEIGVNLLNGRSVKLDAGSKAVKLSTLRNNVSHGNLKVGDEVRSSIFSKGVIDEIADAGKGFKQVKISFEIGQSIFFLFKST